MIHYHGASFSGSPNSTMALMSRHAMVSFARPEPVSVVAEICQSFTIDNGAFSAWKSDTEFDIEGYARFIKKWYRHPAFDWYVIPDVIDGDSDDNMKMRGAWSKFCQGDMWELGVPVWHLHEPLEVLTQLAQAYARIALGSSGEFADVGAPPWWARMTEAMEVVTDEEGQPKAKLHGLRMLDPTIFSQFPFASADSTNVARNIGIDSRWTGAYAPASKYSRALILMERIEKHASASRWSETNGIAKNLDLFS